MSRTTLILLSLLLAGSANAQKVAPPNGGPYTLTIFANQGANSSSAAVQGASGSGSNLGHVFIGLTNGEKQMYLGYYGAPDNPSRGQLRVDADLMRNGDWDWKKTYPITEQGYSDVHKLIDTWATDGKKWATDHNCGDFAEAAARIAGVPLGNLPKVLGLNTPRLWAKYLSEHGGTANPQRANGCGPGYHINPGWIAASRAPVDLTGHKTVPWRDPKYGPLDSRGYVVRCIPDKK